MRRSRLRIGHLSLSVICDLRGLIWLGRASIISVSSCNGTDWSRSVSSWSDQAHFPRYYHLLFFISTQVTHILLNWLSVNLTVNLTFDRTVGLSVQLSVVFAGRFAELLFWVCVGWGGAPVSILMLFGFAFFSTQAYARRCPRSGIINHNQSPSYGLWWLINWFVMTVLAPLSLKWDLMWLAVDPSRNCVFWFCTPNILIKCVQIGDNLGVGWGKSGKQTKSCGSVADIPRKSRRQLGVRFMFHPQQFEFHSQKNVTLWSWLGKSHCGTDFWM